MADVSLLHAKGSSLAELGYSRLGQQGPLLRKKHAFLPMAIWSAKCRTLPIALHKETVRFERQGVC